MTQGRAKSAPPIAAPFTICVDSREQRPYSFEGLTAGFVRGNPPVVVPTMRAGLPNGDYSLFGHPSVAIERKSKEDLYGSVARRANFVGRLERMSELCGYNHGTGLGGYAAVVVEAEFLDLLANLHPRSMSRTLIAWSIRYPVRWWFCKGRAAGELITYRLIERFYIDYMSLTGQPIALSKSLAPLESDSSTSDPLNSRPLDDSMDLDIDGDEVGDGSG